MVEVPIFAYDDSETTIAYSFAGDLMVGRVVFPNGTRVELFGDLLSVQLHDSPRAHGWPARYVRFVAQGGGYGLQWRPAHDPLLAPPPLAPRSPRDGMQDPRDGPNEQRADRV